LLFSESERGFLLSQCVGVRLPLFVALERWAIPRTKGGSMSDKALDELAEWIDPGVIAEAILQELESQEIEPTLANGQKV